ncbi:amino acid/polyamine transporter I [Crepidotus variabilis]|uniref:Amino acid/polyamine transporter I n=1 Tax=Crepidotus variabilis TaxID=179855 RepID=A0A9P6JPZ1_9AGAR|nr:amino acid/polyamine transporter I [Crepidotus variabilis]
MGVIASVSSTLSFGLVNGGHVGMVFGWLVPCFFVMFIALSMAELASSMPTSAGLYYFAAKLAPERYSPLASWITGWANVTGQVTLVCGIDYTCAQMITTAITVGTDGRTIISAGGTYGILLALLICHGLLCSSGTKVLARLNLIYAPLTIGTTMAAIVSLLVLSKGNRATTKEAFTSFENNSGWSNNVWTFFLSFTAAMWTLTGYDSACHVSEETANAQKAAPAAIILSVMLTASLGWLTLIAVSFATPSVSDVLSSDLPLPMGQVFLNNLGKSGMLAIWGAIIVVQFVTAAAQTVDASRVVFAFARDNALPGSFIWKRINTHTQTPVNAVWFTVGAAAICGLLGFSETALISLAGSSVIGLYISYAVPIFLRVTSGRSKLIPGPFGLGRLAVPIGTIAVAWVIFIVIVLLFPPGQHINDEDMNYAVVIIMAVFLFATLSWVTSARKWFIGPVRTIDDVVAPK